MRQIGTGLFLLLLNTLAFPQEITPGIPLVTNFSTLDYRAGIQNWHITQDNRGLLYIANNFGMLEYDGTQWTTYPVPNGTKVRSVAVDRRGRKYVGSQGDFGYFFPDDRGALQYVSLAESLTGPDRNFDEAWRVYVDLDKVYFCTFSNIYVYEPEGMSVVRSFTGLDHSFLVNRELYVNRPVYGLGKVHGDSIRAIPGGEFFANTSVASVLPVQPGHLLVATFQNGVFLYNDEDIRPWNPGIQEFLKESIVNCMVRLRNGNFAIGTQYNGLIITDPRGHIQWQLTRGRGISTRTVLSLYEDELNNLWVGQNNGISYVETGSPFTFINEQVGLPGSGYAALLENNRLYLGTNTGLYLQHTDGSYHLVEGTRGQVYSIGNYNQNVLVGHHNGTFRIEGTRAVTVSQVPGSWTFQPLTSAPNRMVGGHYGGLQLFELHGQQWAAGSRLEGFGESSRVMQLDAHGDLWVTHGYKGVFRLRLTRDDLVDTVMFYGEDKGFPSNLLINVFRIRNELVFTSQQGLFVYDPSSDRFHPHTFLNQYLGEDNVTWFLEEDALGNIYFISRDHIGRLRKNAVGEYAMETNPFGKLRKYLNDDLQNVSVLQNNLVLFGAKEGFILYNPFQTLPQRPAFHTWIRDVSTDDVVFAGNHTAGDSVVHQQQASARPTFPFASNSIAFTFSANAFESGEDIQYQVFLESYDKGWLPWSSQTRKEYTNLKEGNYIFHVRARNINGEVSAPAFFSFTVEPPWYRSVWAYLLYGVSVVSLLFASFRLLEYSHRKEQQLLEEKQRQELDRKETQLEQLSLKSQEEITRLQNEKLESELRHMNNELATSTMHLLNKNEFITGLKGNLDHLVRKTQSEELKKELHRISKQIEQNISADDDWEHFQFHFDRVHGDFSNRFKATFPTLSPQEIKLSAYLRMNLSSKEIAQLLNISVRGVEISRYRLRKKLQLPRQKNLQEFILNF